MKPKNLLAYVLPLVALTSPPKSEAASASLNFFYDSLDPYGDWVEVGDYGYCWHPANVEADWRPYTEGSWAYTDAGWTWVSEEPYGWAVYHYGRWAEVDRVGWVWVPGTEWGPAWVSWRRGDHHVGWAPLPPESRLRASVNFGPWVDAQFDIGPSYYSFVDVRDLGAPRLRTVLVSPRENFALINQTTNITNITYQNNVVINNGPDYNVVVKESRQPIRRLKLERSEALVADGKAGHLRTRVEGDALMVASPVIENRREAPPKQLKQKIAKGSVNRGWQNVDGDPKKVEMVRAKMKSEAKVPANLPKADFADTDPAAPDQADANKGKLTNQPPQPDAVPRDRKPGVDKPAKGQKGERLPAIGEGPTPGKDMPEPPVREVAPQPRPDAPPPKPERLAPKDSQPPRPEQRDQRPEADRPVPKPEAPAGNEPKIKRERPDLPEKPELPDRPERQGRPEAPNPRSERREAPPQIDRPGKPAQPDAPAFRGGEVNDRPIGREGKREEPKVNRPQPGPGGVDRPDKGERKGKRDE